MNRHLIRRALASLFLFLSILAIGVKTADATHFLGGTLRWEKDLTYLSTTHFRYIVVFEANWRRSFPSWMPANPTVGVQFDPGSYSLSLSGTGFSTNIPLPQTAVAVNAPEDWLIGQSVRIIDIPKTAFPVTINFTGGDRLSVLLEGNRDAQWILQTVIPNGAQIKSPSTTMLPRIYMQKGAAAALNIPTQIAPGGVTNTIEIASLAESALRIARPMGVAACTTATAAPVAACVACATTGGAFCAQGMQIAGSQITWTPQVAGIYAVQFKITSRDATNLALSSVPLDMIFEVLEACPTCTPPVMGPLPASVNVYAGNTLTLPVSASDASVGQTVTLSHTALPPGALFTVLTPPSNTIAAQLQWTPSLANLGNHTVCFQATDSTGLNNLGNACTTINVILDQPPVLFCSVAPAVTASVTTGALVNLQAGSYDAEGAAVTVNWSVGSTTFATSGVPASQTSPFTVGAQANFPIGTTVVTVTATEGPRTSSCTINVTVNKIPQSIAFGGGGPISFGGAGLPLTGTATSNLGLIFEVISGPGSIGVGNLLNATGVGAIEVKASQPGDAFYAPATPVFAFIVVNDTTAPVIAPHGNASAEAGAGGVAVVTYSLPSYTDDVSPAGSAACVPASGSSFSIGTTQVTCTASDAAGNTASSTFNVNVADTTAPTIGTNSDITTPATGPAGAAVTFATPTASDLVDPVVTVVCVPPSGSTFSVSTHTVTCTATDAHNNSASSTFSVTVTNTAPTFTPPADISVPATSPGGANVSFTASGSDLEDNVTIPAACDRASGSLFPLGATVVNCTVTDAAGAVTPGDFTVTVTNTPPTFTPPADISVPATSPGGASVSFSAIGNDAEDITIVAVCNRASGSLFPLGATTVSCTVTDVAGAAVSGSFTVTVTNTAPAFTPPANISVPATNPGGANVSFTATGSDLEDNVTIPAACDRASGSLFPLGPTVVNCTVTDTAGAVTPGSFTVTVTNTAPTFTPPANISVPATSPGGANVSFTAIGNDVEDLTIVAVCNRASGSVFTLGATTVSCTVTDVAGAAVSGSFTVTVTNNPPTFTPPANISVPATSPGGANVSFTAIGNDVEQITIPAVCTRISGSLFALGATTVNCTVTDVAGAAASGSFTVTVTNNAPTITVPANITKNATSAAGVAVTYAVSGNDLESGALTPTCTKASGATFPIGVTTVSCKVTDGAGAITTGTFTVTIDDPITPGEMSGDGFVRDDDAKYFFSFRATENARGNERARLSIRIDEDGWKWFKKNNRDRDRHNRDDRFETRTVDFISFSDDPTIRPGRARRPQIDTVVFSGVGEWNGRGGYRYEATAQDAGEPGRHRESIKVTIWSPNGQIVAQFEGDLDGGNIRSSRIRH